MFTGIAFILGFGLGWLVRWKLDGIIDAAKNVPNYLGGKKNDS
jgi:hypothetical protein